MLRSDKPSRVGLPVRRKPRLSILLVLAALLAWPHLASAQEPAGMKTPALATVSDAAVRTAIDRGLAWLASKQAPDGSIPNRHAGEYTGGGESLAALAWLWAGRPRDQAPLKATLAYLDELKPGMTYTRSLRAMTYSLLSGSDARNRLAGDVEWLLAGQFDTGGWGYGRRSAMTRLRPEWTDASNSQFALLALRDAADAGAGPDRAVWRQAEKYWRSFRNADGGWGYQPAIDGARPQRSESHGSMTAAAAASYMIFARRLDPDLPNAFSEQIDGALKWLAGHYDLKSVPKYVGRPQPSQLYYYLFTLGRVIDSGGLRTLRDKDFAGGVAAGIFAEQRADGSWNGSVIDTAFAVLCLQRARAAVVINQVQWSRPAGWAGANVARRLARRLRTRVTWQRVAPEWAEAFPEAPVLYVDLAGGDPWPQALDAGLRKFVHGGGTCLIQAPPGDDERLAALTARFRKLFGDYRQGELEGDHLIFRVPYPIEAAARPRIVGIGDGCRTRIFILADDVAGAWRKNVSAGSFDLADNIVYYATGGMPPAGRFEARWAAPAAPPTKRSIPVARLRYAGDWNVCPLAFRQLGDRLAHSRSTRLRELPAVAAAKPIDPTVALLWLTGNTPPKFSDEELANLRVYLDAGGTLLIDPATGREDFLAAATAMAHKLLGADQFERLGADSPLLTGRFGGMGADVTKLRLLRRPDDKYPTGPAAWRRKPLPAATPELRAARIDGRIAVIVSARGLTCSIEGTPCLENAGYLPDDARRLALNVVLYAASAGR